MKLRIVVTLKPGVLDPQGRAIHHALGGLGFTGVEDVRAGNKDLKSERSENFSAGLVFTPTPDLMFSVDWWRIEQNGVVGVFESQDHLNLDAIMDPMKF